MHATKQIEIQGLRAVKLMLNYARSTKLTIDTQDFYAANPMTKQGFYVTKRI